MGAGECSGMRHVIDECREFVSELFYVIKTCRKMCVCERERVACVRTRACSCTCASSRLCNRCEIVHDCVRVGMENHVHCTRHGDA